MTRHLVSGGGEAGRDGLRGFCALNADLVALHEDPPFVVRAEHAEGRAPQQRVVLVSGGGSGHEPLHTGFVGAGMLDAAVPGEIFSSPSADQIRLAMQTVHAGRGVLQVVKNYTGDVINFTLAAEECRDAGIEVEMVVVDDDVPSAERGSTPGRRGTVATVLVEKICGAAAARGDSLAEVAELGRRVVDRARSVGLAVQAGSNFTAEQAFELDPSQVEMGVGIHGERGTDRVESRPLSELVDQLMATLDADLPFASPVLLAVNGLGASTPLELDAVTGHALRNLERRGIEVQRAITDDLVSSLDMRGFSITVLQLDEELRELWDAPVHTAHWRGTDLSGTPGVRPRLLEAREQAASSEGESGSEFSRQWLQRFLRNARDRADELGELDRRAGDGDFGPNLVTALDRVDSEATEHPFVALSRGFAATGGTSGPLLALWFRTLARGVDGSGHEFAEALATATTRVQELGGASAGDKTMVDAMLPAVAAAEAAGDDLPSVVDAAAEAAERAAQSTDELVAQRGRGSYVGEAGRGVKDPGALLIALFLGSAAG